MRRHHSAFAWLAILCLVFSIGVELDHQHSTFDQSTFECAIDHDSTSKVSSDSDPRAHVSKAENDHRHECLACRTGHHRSLTASTLLGLSTDQLTDDALAISSLVQVGSQLPSGLTSRGPPAV